MTTVRRLFATICLGGGGWLKQFLLFNDRKAWQYAFNAKFYGNLNVLQNLTPALFQAFSQTQPTHFPTSMPFQAVTVVVTPGSVTVVVM